jgi:hypothetical protein
MNLSAPVWQATDAVVTAVTGKTLIDYDFVVGSSPFSTFGGVTGALATYYAVIFGGREVMKNRAPFQLKPWTQIHNIALTAVSGLLLALTLEQLLPQLYSQGLTHTICGAGGWTRPLEVLYNLNYIVKYIEFVDTVLLMLKKKPLTFLHTYHHGATAFLCYAQLLGQTSISWVPITINLFVHCLMYNYFFLVSCGRKVWYKRYITMIQIVQFVVDLGFIYWVSYNVFAMRYFAESAPGMAGQCALEAKEVMRDMSEDMLRKHEFAALTGLVCLTSYLFLFIAFYFATYTPASGLKSRGKQAQSNVVQVKASMKPVVEEMATNVLKVMKPLA